MRVSCRYFFGSGFLDSLPERTRVETVKLLIIPGVALMIVLELGMMYNWMQVTPVVFYWGWIRMSVMGLISNAILNVIIFWYATFKRIIAVPCL